jgi:hypothetical protein
MAALTKRRHRQPTRILTRLVSFSGTPLEWPDPATWPAETRAWFNAVRGEYGPKDLFVFDGVTVAMLLMEDAYSGAAMLPVDETNWNLDYGYPILVFEHAFVEEYTRILTNAGYNLHFKVFPQKHQSSNEDRTNYRFARVVDISIGRRPELFKERERS